MNSFVDALQKRIQQLEQENKALKMHAPYGILARAAFEIEKRKVTNAQYVVFGDIDNMHGLNTQYGYEVVNEKIRAALQIRETDLLSIGLWFSGDEIVFVIRGDAQGFCDRVKESFSAHGMGITLAHASIVDHGSIDAAIQATADNVQWQKVGRK
jgi:hypothetical protein